MKSMAKNSEKLAVIGQRMQNPARVMIGHPFNPPHKIPVVEVCAADVDNAEPIKRLMAFYESCDRVPVLLQKPVPCFVVNRLQSDMLREAIQWVSEGVVDVKGVDDIVLNSIGIRLASIGPVLITHLGSQGG
jgi:ketoreductase RED1